MVKKDCFNIKPPDCLRVQVALTKLTTLLWSLGKPSAVNSCGQRDTTSTDCSSTVCQRTIQQTQPLFGVNRKSRVESECALRMVHEPGYGWHTLVGFVSHILWHSSTRAESCTPIFSVTAIEGIVAH